MPFSSEGRFLLTSSYDFFHVFVLFLGGISLFLPVLFLVISLQLEVFLFPPSFPLSLPFSIFFFQFF